MKRSPLSPPSSSYCSLAPGVPGAYTRDMRRAAVLLGLALAAPPVAAEVVVRVSGDHVDLTATAAPLADILDRLARQTGMKVVYEGPAPRQLVTLSLHDRTPTETVLAVFEGLGINYALLADASGARVQTLMVAGSTAASPSSSASSSTARPSPAVPTLRRPFGPPPGASPEASEPAFDEGAEEPMADEPDFAGLPPGSEAGGGAAAPDPSVPNANLQVPAVPPPAAGVIPAPPQTPFSASPFTPQPQPFPPLPPGAPTGTGNPPTDGTTPANPPQ